MAGDESSASDAAFFLIVEDDRLLARTLVRYVSLFAPTRVVRTVEAAREVLQQEPGKIAGAILDVGLPDGNGLDLLAEIRKTLPLLPAIVLTGQLRPDYVNRATELGAPFVSKSDDPARIANLVLHFASAALPLGERATLLVEEFCRAHHLTEQESEIVRRYVSGTPRELLAEALGLNENTLKTRVRSVLKKCSARSLEEIFRHLFYSSLSVDR